MNEQLCEVCGTPTVRYDNAGPVVHTAHGLEQCPLMAHFCDLVRPMPKRLPDPETGNWPRLAPVP